VYGNVYRPTEAEKQLLPVICEVSGVVVTLGKIEISMQIVCHGHRFD